MCLHSNRLGHVIWSAFLRGFQFENKMYSRRRQTSPPGSATWRTQPKLNNVVWRPTGAAISRTGRKMILANLLHYMKTWRHPQDRRQTWLRPNVSRGHQGTTEPRPQVARVENLVKLGRVIFEICKQTIKQTYKHTDTLAAILRTLPGGK